MQIEQIKIIDIDEPEHAMRSDAWSDDIESLAKSIAQFGLLQPITLRKNGERYEVIAGHRRLLAHKHLGYPFISGIVREADKSDSDAMKVHENLYRADVNPVDQAVFLYEYMERAGLNIDELAKQLNRTVAWVTSRIQILAYPPYLIEFVGEGKLSMATAEILNQIPNELIREKYCRDAAIIGLSATRAKYWVSQASIGANTEGNVHIVEPPTDAPAGQKAVLYLRCTLDGQEYPATEMTMVYVQNENLEAYEQVLKEARKTPRYDTEGGRENEPARAEE
jgi:ParB family chromosome partitioning protein